MGACTPLVNTSGRMAKVHDEAGESKDMVADNHVGPILRLNLVSCMYSESQHAHCFLRLLHGAGSDVQGVYKRSSSRLVRF